MKHVSFKSDNESPQTKKPAGSMRTIEEENSGEFDKVRSPGIALSATKKKQGQDNMVPESDLRDLALVLNEI